jgi:hypothetical protein
MSAPVDELRPDVTDLLPAARKLTREQGALPSKRALKTALRVGSAKADAVLEHLEEWYATEATPGAPESTPDPPADPGRVPGPQALPDPVPQQVSPRPRRYPRWPVLLLALPAAVAIWSGWVGLGELTGFGVVHPLPGIWDRARLNTAITLPIGLEAYAAYALGAWLSPAVPTRARIFAGWSSLGAVLLGFAGQAGYHLMVAAGYTRAPWGVTTAVACLPVAVLGMGAALAHLLHAPQEES